MPQISPLALLLLFLYMPKSVAQYLAPMALMAILYQSRRSIGAFLIQKFLILGALVAPLLVALFLAPGDALRFISIFVLIAAFPFSNVKMNGLSRAALLCFYYAFVFQLGILLDIPFFAEFRSQYYPAEFETWTQGDFEASDFGFRSVRAAGLFYNPNVAALMSLFSYVIYAISLRPSFSGRLHMITLMLAVISLVLAGSRTYLFALVLIVVLNFYKSRLNKIGLFAIAGVFLFGFVNDYIFQDFIDKSGSVYIKMEILFNYINSMMSRDGGWFSLVFGGEYKIQFDNDIGYIIGGWGLLGMLSVIAFSIFFMTKIQSSWKILVFFLATMIGNSLFFGLLTAPLMVCLCVALSKIDAETMESRSKVC